MKRLKKVFNSLSAKVSLAIFCMVLPINVIAYFATETSIQKTIEQVCLSKQDIVNVRMKDLEKKMDSSTALLSWFFSKDSDAITMFQQTKTGEIYKLAKMRFYSKLRSERNMIDGADGYYFYMQQRKEWLQYGSMSENTDIREYIINIIEESPQGWSLYEKSNGNQYLVYSFIRGKMIYGCWFRTDVFLEELKKAIGYDTTSAGFQNGSVESDFKKYQIAAEAKKCFLKVLLNRSEVLQDLNMYPYLVRFSVILLILVIPFLYWIIHRLLLSPLDTVRNAHHELQTGNQDYRIRESGNSLEVKNIYDSFNTMADDLQRYKFDAYEKEIARQDMEILNLQLQIRPHFLLNMFNLLYTLLIEGKTEDLQDIILYLSNYFRYIFRDGKEKALFSKEFDMIQQYLHVAAIRYRGRVVADYEIEPKILLVRVPPLLIHNFVENAIKHGIKESGILHIFVAGEYEKGTVRFTILDDGNGMNKEALEENRRILQGEYSTKAPEAHLGLYNSFRRLRYAYGDSAAVSLDSEFQKGTRYTITFRYELDEGGQDEAIDR